MNGEHADICWRIVDHVSDALAVLSSVSKRSSSRHMQWIVGPRARMTRTGCGLPGGRR